MWRAKQCGISGRLADYYMELAWSHLPDDQARTFDAAHDALYLRANGSRAPTLVVLTWRPPYLSDA
jgi:hypothetical protein